MAWRSVNYSCGHSEDVQFYGPGRERDRKQEWMERGVCPACYRAEKEQERKQDNDRAASLVSELGFAPLVGSDKQIAWATSIRQQAYERIISSYKPLPGLGYSLLVQTLSLETSAKWWIDNRTADVQTLLKRIIGNHPQQMDRINATGRAAKEQNTTQEVM